MIDKKNSVKIRVYPEVKSKLDNLRREVQSIEKKDIKFPELMRRITNIERLKDVLVKDAKFKFMNRRGLVFPIMTIFIMVAVLMVIIIGFYIWSLVSPPVVSSFGDITSTISGAFPQGDAGYNATQSTFVPVNQALQNFKWIGYSILISMFIGYFILCFYVRTYPFLILLWFGCGVVLIFASIYLSISYQDISAGGGFVGDAYKSWTVNDTLLSYLPHIISTVIFIGGLIMFIIVSRDNEVEVVI